MMDHEAAPKEVRRVESAEDKVLAQSAYLPTRTEGRGWSAGQKWRLGVGLAVGALLLFCDWTDYSLAGTWADLMLPVVGIVAGVMALRASKYVPRTALKVAAKIVALVTLVEGTAVVVIAAILAIMSPAGMMLVASAVLGEEQVHAVVSPDGTRVAEEYYRW